ncbi:hypothetical protein Lal_00012432, partial [Lupinus albus]
TTTLVAISIYGSLVSFNRYTLYTAFGQPSQQLRDPFELRGMNNKMIYPTTCLLVVGSPSFWNAPNST